MPQFGWVGFDLDGTLAQYHGWQGGEHIGEPIPSMVAELIRWREDGYEVRIMTARACDPEQVPFVQDWCQKHLGFVPEVTNKKDYGMIRLYDDRAVAVESNTGRTLGFP